MQVNVKNAVVSRILTPERSGGGNAQQTWVAYFTQQNQPGEFSLPITNKTALDALRQGARVSLTIDIEDEEKESASGGTERKR